MLRTQITRVIVYSLIASLFASTAFAQEADPIELSRQGDEYSAVRLSTASRGTQKGIALHFTGSEDMHYYATAGIGDISFFRLEIQAKAATGRFGDPVYPPPHDFYDAALEMNIPVYVGDFTVFLPIQEMPSAATDVTVTIAGQTCTSQQCLFPFTKELTLPLNPSKGPWPALEIPEPTTSPPTAEPQASLTDSTESSPTTWGAWLYFLLAIGAGLSINIMPCVLPVIPLVIMKLLEQSKQAGKQRLLAGFTFCAGIVSFFILFAILAAIIQAAAGQAINPNDLYRYPGASIALFLFIVFFGLAMMDIVPIVLPGKLSGVQTSASSLWGSLGMGFFAAVLSIPCSGALLGFVLAWTQTQPLIVSSTVFILIGIGMALPYAILISIPKLLERIPKPGTWMEHFKKACGFLLFAIAVKLTLAGLPKERLLNVLMYGIIFAFCAWVWGQWVTFATPVGRKRLVRSAALLLAIGSGFWLLPDTTPIKGTALNWGHYEATAVANAQAEGRPVLLKFTADWCTNCKKVEKQVYRNAEMVQLIEARGILPIKADTTTIDKPATTALTEVYGEGRNIPVTILLLPGQEPHKLRGINIGEGLRALIEPLPVIAQEKPQG